MADRIGRIKGGNAGLVTTTAGPDIVHIIAANRSFVIRKVLAYNNTGANVTLIFGTLTNVAGWLPTLPTLVAIDTFDNPWGPNDLPFYEFIVDTTAAAGSIGTAYVQASAVGVLVTIEVEEFAG